MKSWYNISNKWTLSGKIQDHQLIHKFEFDYVIHCVIRFYNVSEHTHHPHHDCYGNNSERVAERRLLHTGHR